jgi:uncharacterized protein (TIGR02996 family)
MTDGEALLKAIIDEPEDDTPRLVYADWLDENGDPDRAEFIRVQVALARLAPDEDGHRLEVRANELLARHEEQWARPLRGLVLWHDFRRGFVERVGVEARTFLERPDHLFRAAPVRGAAIRVPSDVLPAVTASPSLARLRLLGLVGKPEDGGAVRVAESPGLAGVEALDVSGSSRARSPLRLPCPCGSRGATCCGCSTVPGSSSASPSSPAASWSEGRRLGSVSRTTATSAGEAAGAEVEC